MTQTGCSSSIASQIGCGTSIPSLYILHRIFSAPPSQNQTHIHLQDYNASVLELVTIPNIILTWCSYNSDFLSFFTSHQGHRSVRSSRDIPQVRGTGRLSYGVEHFRKSQRRIQSVLNDLRSQFTFLLWLMGYIRPPKIMWELPLGADIRDYIPHGVSSEPYCCYAQCLQR